MIEENQGLSGRSPAEAGSGCQPTASAASASSQSGIPNAEEAFHIGVQFACARLADYARRLAGAYEQGPCDPTGWPETTEGAARHELLAFAGCIEECAQHESLSPHLCSLASGMSAFGQDPKGLEAKPASPVGEAETPKVSS